MYAAIYILLRAYMHVYMLYKLYTLIAICTVNTSNIKVIIKIMSLIISML